MRVALYLRNFAKIASIIVCCLAMQAQAKYTVKIDSANFRRLRIGIDRIALKGRPKSLERKAAIVRDTLEKLLTFSGLFAVIGIKATKKTAPDYSYWRTIGADALIEASLKHDGKDTFLKVSLTDLIRKTAIASSYYQIKPGEKNLQAPLRHFVDKVLLAYTGKPGIFQSKIVFIGRKKRDSPKQVYLCDPEGKNIVQLTKHRSIHVAPTIGPRGETVLFTSFRSGQPNLYSLDLASSKISLFSGGQSLHMGGAFSPDGQLVAFSISKGGNTEIFLQNVKTKRRKPLLVGDGLDVEPRFSPDGRWLAYVSGRYGNPHIFRAELVWNRKQSDVRIKGDKRLSFAGWYNSTPAWSPDSKKIAFAGFDKDIDRFDLFIMNHDGSKLERLTLNSGDNEHPSYSPNGYLIAFQSNRIGNSSRKGRYQLYVMKHDGSEQRKLDLGMYEAQSPFWGPNIADGL